MAAQEVVPESSSIITAIRARSRRRLLISAATGARGNT